MAEAKALRECGFFDETYYRAQRGLSPEIDAAADYLLNGSNVAPGPLFDAPAYLREYPDVAASGLKPLAHYVNHGRAEGRSNVFAGEHWWDGKPRLVVPLPPSRPEPGNLAVVLDVAHPEAVAETCRALAALPGRWTLLVGLAADADKAFVADAVARAGLNADFECQVISNARNTLAVLSTFAPRLLRHEYLIHLRTGAPQGARDDSLIASPPLIDTVIQTLEAHKNIGMVFAAQDEFGFWARVDAVRSILELAPSEIIPNGVTDTFIRSVTAVARKRGYSFVEYDSMAGEWRQDWAAGNLRPYLTYNMDRFSVLAEQADIISFDVFDTLLLRDSLTPDAVQRYAGLLLAGLHPEVELEFFARRKAAEHVARSQKAFQGDVGLSEIYAKFGRTAVWTEEVVALARRLEEDTDAHCLRKKPGMEEALRFAKRAGKRVIALSDTYYSADQVRSLLRRQGLAHYFDALYVSSDQGARKDRGDLWDKVQTAEHVEPTRWLHVGDNEHSDIRAAYERGLNYLHILRPAERLRRAGLNLKSCDSLWATDLAMGPAANALVMNTSSVYGCPLALTDVQQVGFAVFGPIVFAFLQWIVRHPALKEVSSLHFLSREGFLLHRIYGQLRDRHPELRLPPGSYLFASRRATLSASQGLDFAPHRLTADINFDHTMAEFVRQRVGIELAAASQIAQLPVKLPSDNERVLRALQSLKGEITSHASSELKAYRAYLDEAGLSDSPAPGVVDIGYSATIQAGLQIIAERPMTGFYFGTSPSARQVEERGGRAFGYLVEDTAPTASMEPVMACSLLMEAFLSAPHGQLIAFEFRDGRATPVFRASSYDTPSASILAELHEGAARYCTRLSDTYGSALWRASIDKHIPQEPFKALVERLIDIPADLKQALHVEDDFSDVGVWRPLETPVAPWKL